MAEAAVAQLPPVPGWPSRRGTLARRLDLGGRGLHTGRRCRVNLHPAPVGHGVVFVRPGRPPIPALLQWRYGQPLCTALKGAEGDVVRTTEHLLAALRACGIDDALVELSGEEVPILDGSAQPWIAALQEAGRREYAQPLRYIEVLDEVVWEQGPHRLGLAPNGGTGLELEVTMTMKDVGVWHWQGALTPAGFRGDIAAARSFGRLKLAIPAMLYGLARGIPILRGAGPWCAATLVGSRVIGGTRMPDEFVRHKVVDMLGDFALLGAPLLARVSALRPTHDGNFGLMQALMARPSAWRHVEFDERPAGCCATGAAGAPSLLPPLAGEE